MTNLQQGFEELHESSSLEDHQYRSKTAREYVDRAIGWIEHHPGTPYFMYLHVFDPHHQYEPRLPMPRPSTIRPGAKSTRKSARLHASSFTKRCAAAACRTPRN